MMGVQRMFIAEEYLSCAYLTAMHSIWQQSVILVEHVLSLFCRQTCINDYPVSTHPQMFSSFIFVTES